MRQIVAKRNKKDVPLSKICSLTSKYTVIEKTPARLVDDAGELMAIYLPGVLSQADIQAGRHLIKYKAPTTGRGMAAGKIVGGTARGYFGDANMVHSSVVGYMENGPIHACRMTAMTIKNKELFAAETVKLFRTVTHLFKKHAPSQYRKQRAFLKKINGNMRMRGTVYTTATVNVDFRTRAHTDSGDYHAGLGNLCVFTEEGKSWSGGEFLLPNYNVAFRLREGDVLFVNVHETHCNAPIRGSGRISLVLYAREKLESRCHNISKETLEAGGVKKQK